MAVNDRGDGSVLLAAAPRASPSDVWSALGAALRGLPGTTRVVVLTAGLFTGVRAATAPLDAGAPALRDWQDPVRRLDRADLVAVAALAGPVDGAALELSLACDLRVLGLDARLAVTDVAAGQVPALGGLARLDALVGPARALELALTARAVSAGEAVGLGLASLAVPPADLAAAVDDLVAALLAAPRPAVTEAKALLRGGPNHGPPPDPLEAAAAAALRLAADEG